MKSKVNYHNLKQIEIFHKQLQQKTQIIQQITITTNNV